MVNGVRGGLILHAQKLVAQDLKLNLELATVRSHQMVAKTVEDLHRLQPLAIPINVQVR